MNFKVEILPIAAKYLSILKKSDPSSFKKAEKLVEELRIHPKTGTGQPECLKHNNGEVWSRKINKKDRLVYEIMEEQILVLVLSAKGHYGDK